MLELEVKPERSVSSGRWELTLGMPLAQVIQIVKTDCANLKDVHVVYDEQRPMDKKFDLIVDLSQNGLRLLFDPLVQRLKIIEVYDVGKVVLKYCTKPFSSPDVPPTIEQIFHSFGDTLPGEYDGVHKAFLLNFRGVLFSFTETEGSSNNSRSVVNIGNSESFISNGQPGILSSLAVYCGNDYHRAETPHFPLECFHGNCYSEIVDLEEQDGFFIGLQLSLLADDTHNHGPYQMRPRSFIEHVYLDDSVQDVLSKLGAPGKVYFKSEDKMKIHSANPDKPPHSGQSDYFFNYFTLGLDVLFDATDHRAKKFIMHTNIPGDYNFDIYQRCHFRILLSQLPERECLTGSDSKEIEITPCTKWTEVGNSLTTPTDQPVVLHRGPTVNSLNPFGSTYCHGYQNLIFEVMRNQHIASVTVYAPPINRT